MSECLIVFWFCLGGREADGSLRTHTHMARAPRAPCLVPATPTERTEHNNKFRERERAFGSHLNNAPEARPWCCCCLVFTIFRGARRVPRILTRMQMSLSHDPITLLLFARHSTYIRLRAVFCADFSIGRLRNENVACRSLITLEVLFDSPDFIAQLNSGKPSFRSTNRRCSENRQT